MKKNFLKKLSFVLASAMVVSVVSPAASAFAAASVKLNATKKYLHLDVDGKNEYDFNIKGKKTGWKYLWESSNEDIAVVNEKNGVVTATGVGTAKVSVVITDKKGKEVDELKATVVVRDNIKEVSIANKPEGDKLAVGAKFDFNRNFVTNSGNTKKTSAVTRWTVEPATGATIDNSGVFVATKAGEYTVTARSFQSTAKFNEWKANPTGKASLVLANASYKLTVAASIKEVAQVDKNTVKVTFDSPVADVAKNIAISQLINGTRVKQSVNEVKMNDDNTVATVKLFVPFNAKESYVVDFTDMESKSFVAATAKYEDVASIKITTDKVVYGEDTEIKVALYNKDNVDITTDDLLSRVSLESAKENGVYFSSNKLTIFTKGATSKITATYHTYKYNSVGQEEGTLQAVATIYGVDKAAAVVGGLKAWTLVASADKVNYSKVEQKIAALETGKKIFVQLETVSGDKKETIESNKEPGKFSFKSSDESILYVADSGEAYPYKAGNVTVIVSYANSGDKSPVATFTITVAPERKATKMTLSANSFVLSNTTEMTDSKTVTVKLFDQMDRAIDGDVKVEKLRSTTDSLTAEVTKRTTDGKLDITFSAFGVEKGTYSYKITAGDASPQVVSVEVQKPDGVADRYFLNVNKDNYDIKIDKDNTKHDAKIEIVAYAKNGVKVSTIDLSNPKFKVTVEVPSNAPSTGIGSKVEKLDNNLYALAAAEAGVYVKAKQGGYKVTLFEDKRKDGDVNPAWVVIDNKSFQVTDSQAVATVTKVKDYYFSNVSNDDFVYVSGSTTKTENVNIINAIKNSFEFKVGGTELTKIKAANVMGDSKKMHVISVVLADTIGGADLEYTVDVKLGLEAKK